MFFFVFGLPGGFAEWCDAATTELARRALGPTELIRADTLEQIALQVIGTGMSQAVVSSRQPGGRLRAALVENGRNFIVALDDPRMALVELVLGQGIGLAAATQTMASSCAALIGYAAAPGALTLEGVRVPQEAETVAAIARHLRIAMDDSEIAEFIGNRAAPESTRSLHDAVAWWSGLAAPEREMAAGALAPYIEHRESGVLPSITWTGDLFFLGDRPNERASGPVDITGRARCLIAGPHIMLPPGSWSMSLTALFSRETTEHDFLVEICTDRPLASITIRPQREGSAEGTIDFALDDSTEHPIAIRISSMRAAFDGAITVVGATLDRAVSATADASDAGLVLAGE